MSDVAATTQVGAQSLGQELRRARRNAGFTIELLAPKLKVNKNTLGAYERGDNLPDVEFLAVFAQRLEVDFAHLLKLRLQSSPELATRETVLDPSVGSTAFLLEQLADREAARTVERGARFDVEIGGERFVLLPRYEVRAGAGGGQVVQSEQIVDHLAFKRDWVLQRLRRDPADLILIEASGDSMADKIRHGDLLLVDTGVDRVHDHAIYALNIGGELMVKYVQRLIAGGCQIFSENPKYPPETLTDQKLNELRVVGQAIWAGGVL